MRLSPQEEYGLRCLLQVAKRAPDPEGAPCRIEDIAEAEGLGYEHCAKVLRSLRLAVLVVSTRGASGGYHLARPADEITVRDVLVGLDGPFFSEGLCDGFAGQQTACVHGKAACAVRGVWRQVGAAIDDVLGRISLAQLLNGEPT